MRWLVIVAAALGCGKSKSDKAPQPEPSTEPGSEHVSNRTLIATKLETISGKAGAVSFTIDLPMAQLKPPEVKGAYSTWEPKQAWLDTPSFTVQQMELPLGSDATGDATPIGDDAKDRTIARAEKLSDGGYLNLDQRNDHAFFRLEVCRPVGSGALCCSVIQRGDKPLEAFAEIVAMAEKICKSLKSRP